MKLMEIIENISRNIVCEDPEDFENIMYDHTEDYSDEFKEKHPCVDSVIVLHDAGSSEDIAVFDAYTNQLLWLNIEIIKKKLCST